MALPHWFSLILIVSVTKVCYAQCVIRTLVPMTVMDTCPMPTTSTEESSSSAEDLQSLLLLARALEMDRASNANNGIDVNALLNTLINALVVTATQSASRGYPAGSGGVNVVDNNNWQSYSPNLSPNYPSQSPSSMNYPPKDSSNSGLDLQLLNQGKDNVLKLDSAGNKVLGVGLASDGGDSSNAGLLNGVTGAVGGLLGGGNTGDGVIGAVGGLLGGDNGSLL